jgi:hypothetical protein
MEALHQISLTSLRLGCPRCRCCDAGPQALPAARTTGLQLVKNAQARQGVPAAVPGLDRRSLHRHASPAAGRSWRILLHLRSSCHERVVIGASRDGMSSGRHPVSGVVAYSGSARARRPGAARRSAGAPVSRQPVPDEVPHIGLLQVETQPGGGAGWPVRQGGRHRGPSSSRTDAKGFGV